MKLSKEERDYILVFLVSLISCLVTLYFIGR